MLDIKDTLRRMSHVGRNINQTEDSEYMKFADVLLSLERERIEGAIKATKHRLSDWAGNELDNFWGSILSLKRIQGVDDIDQFLGDSQYIERIQKYMQAANEGVSLEGIRKAAEAGAGVPFKIHATSRGVILTPLQELIPEQREAAMRTARRLSPASSIIEFSPAENFTSNPMTRTWSDSVYIGPRPQQVMTGPNFNGENIVSAVSADRWSESEEGSFFPTNGLPSNLMREQVWHTPSIGFGGQATLEINIKPKLFNRIKLGIGPGDWYIEYFVNEDRVAKENIRNVAWEEIDKTFEFIKSSTVQIVFRNMAQDRQELYVRGLYIGAQVNSDNRLDWLSKGGLEGEDEEKDIVVGEAKNLGNGGQWISSPHRSPSDTDHFYATLSSSPVKVNALGMSTSAVGTKFKIYHSDDYVYEDDDFEEITWRRLPGIYEMRNGRVQVHPFRARQLKLECTNLKPMLLREYEDV